MSPRRIGLAASLLVLVAAAALAQPMAPPLRRARPRAPGKLVDLAALRVWPGSAARGKVVVHAADVDGEVLRSALAGRSAAWIGAPVSRRVSGTVIARKRDDALAALVAAEPALAVTRPRLRGGGPNVDLDFRAAGTTDLFRVLADVSRANVVNLAPDTRLTLRVKRTPAEAVMAEVARVAGLALDRPAPRVIVVRPTTRGRVGRSMIATGGPAVTLRAHGLPAAHLVALLREVQGPPGVPDRTHDATMACSGGTPVELRLTKVPAETAIDLAALAGGIDGRASRCLVPRILAHVDARDLRLLATVTRGTRRLAAVQHGDDVVYVDDNDAPWQVGDTFVTRRDAGTDITHQLYPDLRPPPLAPELAAVLPIRLAATIVDGAGGTAIVEIAGQHHVWSGSHLNFLDDGRAVRITVTPGAIELDDLDTIETLRLQAR